MAQAAIDPENTLYMDLKDGRVVIALRPDLAPNHVARIKELARTGFYDGTPFHRVIDGFMAQGGDPTGTGMGGSGKNLKAEFSKEKHVRGTASMARAQNPNSADSQFFICFDTANFLDGQYTVWGQVSAGMEHVDSIKKGDSNRNGTVKEPDKILSLRVAADVEAETVADVEAEAADTAGAETVADAEAEAADTAGAETVADAEAETADTAAAETVADVNAEVTDAVTEANVHVLKE